MRQNLFPSPFTFSNQCCQISAMELRHCGFLISCPIGWKLTIYSVDSTVSNLNLVVVNFPNDIDLVMLFLCDKLWNYFMIWSDLVCLDVWIFTMHVVNCVPKNNFTHLFLRQEGFSWPRYRCRPLNFLVYNFLFMWLFCFAFQIVSTILY